MNAVRKITKQPEKPWGQQVEKIWNLSMVLTVEELNLIWLALQVMDPRTAISFNFTKTLKVDRACYPLMHQIKKYVTENNSQFKSFGVSFAVISQLQSDGVANLFTIKNKKIDRSKTIDVEFVTPFINSTISALSVQAKVKAHCGSPRLKDKEEEPIDIVGVISLISNVFVGSISLCFAKETFIEIANRLFGESHTEINQDIENAAAEILNIIFGNAKAELSDNTKYIIQSAFPTVIHGNRLKLKQSQGPTIVLPFQSDAGSFHLEIEIANK